MHPGPPSGPPGSASLAVRDCAGAHRVRKSERVAGLGSPQSSLLFCPAGIAHTPPSRRPPTTSSGRMHACGTTCGTAALPPRARHAAHAANKSAHPKLLAVRGGVRLLRVRSRPPRPAVHQHRSLPRLALPAASRCFFATLPSTLLPTLLRRRWICTAAGRAKFTWHFQVQNVPFPLRSTLLLRLPHPSTCLPSSELRRSSDPEGRIE